MKHLVLFYDKTKTFPQTQTFEEHAPMMEFIQHKLNAGIVCHEYSRVSKYTKETKIIKHDSN